MTADDTTAICPSGDSVSGLLAEISSTGRDRLRGGYSRPVFSTAERDLTAWFTAHAEKRGLDVQTDRNGIVMATLPAVDGSTDHAVVTGSHLDSVPGGGAFDGPLGVASALVAVDLLRARGVVAARPLSIAVFPEEEGSRFGVACLGSRLMTGAIDADRARKLTDDDGTTFAEVAASNGLDPRFIGVDRQLADRIGVFIELHVEQGRGLIDQGRAVGVGRSILAHGRWRLTIVGEGNHAGTTLMVGRRDPVVAAARIIVAVRDTARRHPGARATVGRVNPVPGGTNVIASAVNLWVDARHPDAFVAAALVEEIRATASLLAAEEGCTVTLTEESFGATVQFDPELRDRAAGILDGSPMLETGAGHDAGILSAIVPTAMLFVRNPTGISHSPEEQVENDDAEAGAVSLADVLQELMGVVA